MSKSLYLSFPCTHSSFVNSKENAPPSLLPNHLGAQKNKRPNQHCPTDMYWKACERVLRYLCGSIDHGLHIQFASRLSLTSFLDTDQSNCVDDRSSTSGFCVFLGLNIISWSSRKQKVDTRSSTESEYRALAHTAAEVTQLQGLLKELQVSSSSCPVIWRDNIGVACIAANPVAHACTKHIKVDVHFARDKVLSKQLDVWYVPIEDQIDDILTKPLSIS